MSETAASQVDAPAEPTPFEPSAQTIELLRHLAGHGFTAYTRSWGVRPGDGVVEHVGQGIWVHADADVVRLVMDARDGVEEHRLLLSRHGLASEAALRIAAHYAAMIVASRAR